MQLIERNVLITGGSSGIGLALVKAFCQEGYRVWFTYRTGKDRARAVESESGGRAQGFAFEQGNWVSHEKLLAALPGRVDILINNAALGTATCTAYTAQKQFQDQALMQVNAVGALWLTEAFLPQMKEGGFGKIVMISSVGGGISQFPGFRLADGMSKSALAHLTRQLAAELVHDPIDVFAICPGATDTPMFRASTLDSLSVGARQNLIDGLPKRRLIEPGEIAELAVFLCKSQSSVLHGAVLDASLGLGVHPGLLTSRAAAHRDVACPAFSSVQAVGGAL